MTSLWKSVPSKVTSPQRQIGNQFPLKKGEKMKENTRKILTNRLTLRIENESLLQSLAELEKSGVWRSRNEILNRALSEGFPILAALACGKTAGTSVPELDIRKDIHALKALLSQNAISLNMIEYLTTILYNIEGAKADGIEITPEFLESGSLEQLPEALSKVKKQMTEIEYKRRKRNNA